MAEPIWSVMIASVGARNAELARMLDALAAQIESWHGLVEVVVYWDNFESGLGAARQALLDDARGEWVSFVDDDDELPSYFVDNVMVPLLVSKPDYIGWRMQLFIAGKAQKPTYHSLRYDRWWDDARGYYRHVSHLNPIRAELARLGRFDRNVPEDVDWAQQVHAALPADVREVTLPDDEPMYLYRYDPAASLWSRSTKPTGEHVRPALPSPFMRYHEGSNDGLAV